MFVYNISKFQGRRASPAAIICRTDFHWSTLKKIIFQDFEIQPTCFNILIDILFDALSRYDKEIFFGGGQIFASFIYLKIHHCN